MKNRKAKTAIAAKITATATKININLAVPVISDELEELPVDESGGVVVPN